MPMTPPLFEKPKAVFFDLDGTLIDSAPDLAQAAEAMRSQRGLPPLDYARYRRMAGAGAKGMLGVAFGEFGLNVTQEVPHPCCHFGDFETLRKEFFLNYERSITSLTTLASTRVFEGMDRLLRDLTAQGIAWGVVTNKVQRFTQPLLQTLMQQSRLPGNPSAIVSGDSTPHPKPHPQPLLAACEAAGVLPKQCWYVGDDKRDIDAGKAAGMQTMAVRWGYEGEHPLQDWGADAIAKTPSDILALLGLE